MGGGRLDLPPVWALGAALVSWGLARTLPVAALPGGMGRLLIVAGLALAVWSVFWFRRKGTPLEPGKVPRALIVEGPYRINRNPIYTAMLLILIGWGLALGAASALVPPLVFAVIVTRRFVLGEEAALRAAFGAEAERYFARTRRW